MANQTSGLKGNPAAHRMSNPNNKNRRVRNSAKNDAHSKNAQNTKLIVDGHYNKAANNGNGKPIAAGIVSRNGLNNYVSNKRYAYTKKMNNGLGQREVRRIKNGTNKNHNMTQEQIDSLLLL